MYVRVPREIGLHRLKRNKERLMNKRVIPGRVQLRVAFVFDRSISTKIPKKVSTVSPPHTHTTTTVNQDAVVFVTRQLFTRLRQPSVRRSDVYRDVYGQ